MQPSVDPEYGVTASDFTEQTITKKLLFSGGAWTPALHFDASRMSAPYVRLLLFASWWYSAAAGRSNLLSNGIRSR